jgi:riboflavin kinase/FMN adenylyltransferase
VPLEERDGAPVSSTRIRAALQAGDLPAANAMLGRPFAVAGEVVSGKGEGRKLGFPTINVRPANPCLARLLPFGVYVADTEWGRAVANWGQAPTMGEQAWPAPVLEVHVVGRGEGEKVGRGEGEKVEISLRRFLRPERRFDSVEALREQIKTDVFSASHSQQDRL